MSSYGSSAGMATSAPLVNGVVNNVLFHFSPHINQTLPQIIHIHVGLGFSSPLARAVDNTA